MSTAASALQPPILVDQRTPLSILTIVLCAQFTLTFFVDFGFIYIDGFPRILTWLPEGVAAIVLVFAILSASSNSFIQIPGRYAVWLLLVALVFLIGIIVNDVESGAMFYGARIYLRYLPFLLLPILIPFSQRESFLQLKFVLFFAFIQLPFSLYQFVYVFGTTNNMTGDVVRGTMSTSGHLTMFVVASFAVWTTLFLKKRIRLVTYLVGAPIIVIPSWLNESTGTLFLLPLAILLPLFLDTTKGGRFLRLMASSVVLVALMGGFIWTYSNTFTRWGGDLSNVFVGERGALHYLYKGADENSRADGHREQSEIGRLDSIVMPFLVMDDPVQLAVGLGMGNASSTQSRHFEGEYTEYNRRYGMNHTTYAAILWETGVLGLVFSLWLMAMVYRDGIALSRREDGQGAIGLAAAVLMAFMTVAFAYKNIIHVMQITGSLALLMGHVIGMRAKHDAELRQRSLHS
jgi:hypothetical protein